MARKFLDSNSEAARLREPYPYSSSPRPEGSKRAGGNPNISPMAEGNLNGRPAAMDPAPVGGACMDRGVSFCVPMDDEGDFIYQDD